MPPGMIDVRIEDPVAAAQHGLVVRQAIGEAEARSELMVVGSLQRPVGVTASAVNRPERAADSRDSLSISKLAILLFFSTGGGLSS